MDILSILENSVNSMWFRRESRYDIMQDFGDAHLAMLQPSALGRSNHSYGGHHEADHFIGARNYIKDRSKYRKEMIQIQLCLLCSTDIRDNYSRLNEKKRKRCANNEDIDGKTGHKVEHHLANYCVFDALDMKRKHINEYATSCNNLLEKVDRYVEHLESEYTDAATICDDGVALPLHDFGIITKKCNEDDDNNYNTHLRTSDFMQADKMKAIIELNLMRRLQRNVHNDCKLTKYVVGTSIPASLAHGQGHSSNDTTE